MLLERQKKKDSSDSSSLKNLFRKRSYFLLLWLDSFFFWFFLFLHEGVTSIVVVFSSLETWEHGLWSELRNPKKLSNNNYVKIELIEFFFCCFFNVWDSGVPLLHQFIAQQLQSFQTLFIIIITENYMLQSIFFSRSFCLLSVFLVRCLVDRGFCWRQLTLSTCSVLWHKSL